VIEWHSPHTARAVHTRTWASSSTQSGGDPWRAFLRRKPTAIRDTVQTLRDLKRARSASDVLDVVDGSLPEFDYAHSTASLCKIASLCRTFTPEMAMSAAFSSLVSFQEECLRRDVLDELSLGRTAWVIGRLNDTVPSLKALLPLVAASSVDRLNLFLPEALADLAWACGTTRMRNDTLLEALSSIAQSKIDSLLSHHLSKLAWSFSRLGVVDVPLMESIGAAAIRQAATLEPFNWGHILLACARTGAASDVLLAACTDELVTRGKLREANRWAVCALSPQCPAGPERSARPGYLVWAVGSVASQREALSVRASTQAPEMRKTLERGAATLKLDESTWRPI